MGLTVKEAKQLNESKAAIRVVWNAALVHDGIASDSKFVVFSNANPFIIEHNRLMVAHQKMVGRIRRNIARRERHQAMKDLGLTRVVGNLGGVYYE